MPRCPALRDSRSPLQQMGVAAGGGGGAAGGSGPGGGGDGGSGKATRSE